MHCSKRGCGRRSRTCGSGEFLDGPAPATPETGSAPRSLRRCLELSVIGARGSKNCDQGFALDPRGKEVKIKDLTFWPTGSRCCRPGCRRSSRCGRPRGGSAERCPRTRRGRHADFHPYTLSSTQTRPKERPDRYRASNPRPTPRRYHARCKRPQGLGAKLSTGTVLPRNSPFAPPASV
jgi:hypothetical protein